MTHGSKIPESVLVLIHRGQLEVLLIERADAHGFWQSVTGSKSDPSEAIRDTAIREVQEETGVDCASRSSVATALRDWHLSNVYDIYPRWLSRYASGVTRNTEHVFSLRVPPDTVVRLNPREHRAAVWLPWREAADRCFSPSNAEAILLLPKFAG